MSLSTTPPQVSHGAGATVEASHDVAAVSALRSLAELGLDAVVPQSATAAASSNNTSGDSAATTAVSAASVADTKSPTAGGAGGDG